MTAARAPSSPRHVLLTFASLSWQKGSAAQVISLVGELRKRHPELRFSLLSHCPELDRPRGVELGIDVCDPGLPSRASQRLRSLMLMSKNVRLAINPSTARAVGERHGGSDPESLGAVYSRAGFVIDLSGDSYRDRPGGFAPAHHAQFLALSAARIPFGLVSQSLGPFRAYNLPLVRRVLRNADFIYVRERRTIDLLRAAGVATTGVDVAPDIAFALPVEEPNQIWEAERFKDVTIRRPWVAVSISGLAMRLCDKPGGNRYLSEMARLCEHVHRRYSASVFLVPHEVKPFSHGGDDRSAGRRLVRECLDSPGWIHEIRGDYSPGQLKGFIGRCDALVASRLHAAIAGMSVGVPTLVVAWSHKYEGVMEDLGLARFVWSLQLGGATSVQLFDLMWEERMSICPILLKYASHAKEQIAAVTRRLAERILRADRDTSLTPVAESVS